MPEGQAKSRGGGAGSLEGHVLESRPMIEAPPTATASPRDAIVGEDQELGSLAGDLDQLSFGHGADAVVAALAGVTGAFWLDRRRRVSAVGARRLEPVADSVG